MDMKANVRPSAVCRFGRQAVVAFLSLALITGPLPPVSNAAHAQEVRPAASPATAGPTDTAADASPEALTPSAQEPTPSAGGPADKGKPAGPGASPRAQPQALAAASGPEIDDSPGPALPSQGAARLQHVARTPETLGFGAFNQSIEIEVPKFHGLEPKLSLQYSSGGGLNAGRLMAGYIGVGWELRGLPDIVRTAPINGTPRFDDSDVFQLDGKDLIPCTAGMTSPSCIHGGNYTSKVESYEKIYYNAQTNIWSVWAKDGTRSDFLAVAHWGRDNIESGDDAPDLIRYHYRWLLAARHDVHGNHVDYNHTCRTLP